MGSKKILQDNQFLSTHFDSEPKLNIWGPAGTLSRSLEIMFNNLRWV